MADPNPNTASPKRGFWKGALFRLAAVLIGLSPLVAAELALRALGLGRATDSDDPFVGFSDIHPLFVLNGQSGRYEIPKSRQTHFRPESFLAEKPPDEFRVFVLGGSTVQGRPYAVETSFTTWLELSLNAADPSRHWEVVNCGGISYASYRLVPILQEVFGYEPDLVIVCTGQNEFLEERTYGHIKSAPGVLSWPQRQAFRLRTYTLLREGILRLTGEKEDEGPEGRPVLGPESDAILDWKGGMAKYRRDPAWREGVIAHYAFNLRRMADLAGGAGVPLLFVMPVSNLEWPPFKPVHRDGITEAERREFESLLEEARGVYAQDLPGALELLERAAEIDGEHAMVHYEIGICRKQLRDLAGAERALVRAKDADVCPLRMLEPMKAHLREAAAETGTPLVDAEALIAGRSRSGFPDNEWLIDHVHPTVSGHQLIAEELVRELVRQGFLDPVGAWESVREAVYAKHLERLAADDPTYFARGEQRIRAVQAWAHGLTDREKK